ncbi:transcription repressor OFP6-like isoform X2 [Cucurbita pepo subsp. pepo]|uniref:transcription repressor OFP6-like isoform X2 n=1 Tax=Cucurbita pepo subsp. pepo TaxID=3664 RepID=UPI000C9D2793|nr:transcription repressor OFP6-like isoform X2 [Cucurbita pepo subsp. pepo]
MATRRTNLPLTSLSVDLNICRPKLSHLFHLKPKPSAKPPSLHHFSDSDSETRASITFRGFGRSGGESVAVEKDSDDPYLDFRHSMVQMILENEIYSKHDLRGLLRCFLQLNSPSHHGIIVRAFAEIWDSVFSARSPVSPPIFRF